MHRFFEYGPLLSSDTRQSSVVWAAAGNTLAPGQRGTKHIACAPNTQLDQAGSARVRYLRRWSLLFRSDSTDSPLASGHTV